MALEPLSLPPVPVAPSTGNLAPWSSDIVRSLRLGFDKIVRRLNLALLFADNEVTVGTVKIAVVTGSPEGVLTAAVGSLARRTDGGANTTLYVKESGSGNTGWSPV